MWVVSIKHVSHVQQAASQKVGAPLALGCNGYERLPAALQPVATIEEKRGQRDTYIEMIQSDGTIGAFDEVEDEEGDEWSLCGICNMSIDWRVVCISPARTPVMFCRNHIFIFVIIRLEGSSAV